MIYVQTAYRSERFDYVIDQIFSCFLGTPYRFYDGEALSPSDFLIVYDNEKNTRTDLHIVPNGLLHETTIRSFQPEVEKSNSEVKLFVNASEHFGFDLFSAVFYCISRYEEYLPFEPDQHGRFGAKSSFAFRHGILEIPVVDAWIEQLYRFISKKTKIEAKNRKFQCFNTIDVDNAFAYQGKPIARQSGAFLKHLAKGQFSTIGERIKVLQDRVIDPFDTYEYIKETASLYHVETIFFHLVGELSERDRNISVSHPKYMELLNSLKEWSTLGLHPSYVSNAKPELITTEKKKIENATGQKVLFSRQHFLKIKFPETFYRLIEAGIQRDYSLGYADHIGFRCGTGKQYHFFDLIRNKSTSLELQPHCVMDGTLKDYMKLPVEEAVKKVQQIKRQLIENHSTFVGIWHNETLGETNGWEGWRKVYEEQFKPKQ